MSDEFERIFPKHGTDVIVESFPADEEQEVVYEVSPWETILTVDGKIVRHRVRVQGVEIELTDDGTYGPWVFPKEEQQPS